MNALLKGIFCLGNIITALSLLCVLFIFPEYLNVSGIAWDIIVVSIPLVLHLFWGLMSSNIPQEYTSVKECMTDIVGDIISFTIHLSAFITFFILRYDYLNSGSKSLAITLVLFISTISIFFEMILTIKNSLMALYRLNPISISWNKKALFLVLFFIFF